jgi:hypothetical protein
LVCSVRAASDRVEENQVNRWAHLACLPNVGA